MQKRKAKEGSNAWRFLIFAVVLTAVILLVYFNAPITGQALSAAPTPATCSEYDNGLNYAIKGACTDATGSKEDVCISDTTLREYRCADLSCKYSYFNCQMHGYTGCFDGACYSGAKQITENVSSPLTYQGVLNMLNSCVLKAVKGNSTNKCNSVCNRVSSTCIQAYYYDGATQTLMPTRCDYALNDISKNLICNCCSAPGEMVNAPDLQECCWLKINGICGSQETPYAECTGCGYHCGVGVAAAL